MNSSQGFTQKPEYVNCEITDNIVTSADCTCSNYDGTIKGTDGTGTGTDQTVSTYDDCDVGKVLFIFVD